MKDKSLKPPKGSKLPKATNAANPTRKIAAGILGGGIGVYFGFSAMSKLKQPPISDQFFTSGILTVIGVAGLCAIVAIWFVDTLGSGSGRNLGLGIIIGVVTGAVVAWLYFVFTDKATKSLAWAVFVIFAVAFTGVGMSVLNRHAEIKAGKARRQSGHSNPVSVNDEYNFLGDKLDRHIHLFSKDETRADYAAGPPAIEWPIMVAIPLTGFAICAWGATGFVNHVEIFDWFKSSYNPWLALLIVVIVGNFIRLCWIDLPPSPQSLLVVVLAVAGTASGWFYLRMPGASQIMAFVVVDNKVVADHVWAVLSAPFLLWTLTRNETFRDNIRIVSNLNYHKGSDGSLLDTSPVGSLERNKMANATLKAGWARRIMLFEVVICDDLSKDSQDGFKKTRCKPRQGAALAKVLRGKSD